MSLLKTKILAMSPNQERLKNLCDKLSGLGSELEEGKQVNYILS